MTRAEQISEYANSFNGKGMESEELKEIIRLAIIDGAKWADNHPINPSLPANLDEASFTYENDLWESGFKDSGYTPQEVKDAFKAGAEWMARQGAFYNTEVGWIDGPTVLDWPDNILDGFKMGDEVIVQIRKK